jgi:dolichyldiphosphatase
MHLINKSCCLRLYSWTKRRSVLADTVFSQCSHHLLQEHRILINFRCLNINDNAAPESVSVVKGSSLRDSEMVESRHSSKMLAVLNELTKWTLSSASILFLLLKHDASVMWCLLGSLTSLFLNKNLKLIINDKRPENAQKTDPGMPSTHSNGLGYLATYISIAACLRPEQPHAVAYIPPFILSSTVLALSAFLAWLRVALGYHTYPQVMVGYLLGSLTAMGWHYWGVTHLLLTLETSPGLFHFLSVVTWISGAAFAFKNLLPIWKDFLRTRSKAVKQQP